MALPGYRSRVRGCLLGGAIGDALGAPSASPIDSLARIRAAYGPDGLTGPVLDGGQALVTDDTQMTLFTVEGLMRGGGARGVYDAYLRWFDTQRRPGPPAHPDGWLAAQSWLYAQRAPGNACLSGLRAGWMGTTDRPQNPDSKGCGTVMRSAPFGLRPAVTPADAFALA